MANTEITKPNETDISENKDEEKIVIEEIAQKSDEKKESEAAGEKPDDAANGKEMNVEPAAQNADDDKKKEESGDVEKPDEKNTESSKEVEPETGEKETMEAIGDAPNGVEKEHATSEPPADKDVEMTESTELIDVDKRIIKQLLYYFGDINLPKDKFLKDQIALDEGWVSLVVLLTFKRLLAITGDPKVIANAVLKSGEKLLQLSEDQSKIRRNPEMPVPEYNDEYRKELMTRTAYVKGFPQDTKIEALIEFFEPYGPTDGIHMRHMQDKVENKIIFKGSVFVIFKTIDGCKNFVESEGDIKFKDTVLIRQWQADFVEEKKRQRQSNKSKATEEVEESPAKTVTLPKGTILHIDGVSPGTVRETIKKVLVELCGFEPAYITYEKGTSEGYVRFQEKNQAVEAFKKLTDGKIKIDDTDVNVRVLEGDEEETYLTELSATISKRKSHYRAPGRPKGRKRRGGGADAAPKAKRGRR